MTTKPAGPFWFSPRAYRPGVIPLLPRLGLTRDWGYQCLEFGWLKWAIFIGWRVR